MRRTPEFKYDAGLLVLGGVLIGAVAFGLLRPTPWMFALIPLLGLCGAFFVWCLAARLWLCRDKERLLAKSFTRPVRFALFVPVWMLLTALLYTMPSAIGAEQEALVDSIVVLVLLTGLVAVPILAMALAALAVWTGVRHMKFAPQAETRAYREGPFALALVMCVGVLALCAFLYFYILG